MKPVEPLQLQRLIDGESSIAEVQSLLAAAEQNSHHWQEIALALLEDRAWQSQLQSQLQSAAEQPSTISAITQAQSGESEHVDLAVVTPGDLNKVAGANNQRFDHQPDAPSSRPTILSRRPNRWGWLATVAAVALATIIGYRVGQHSFQLPPLAEQAQSKWELSSDQTQPSVDQQKITPVAHRPDYYLTLPANADSGLQGSVPMYAVDSLDQWEQRNRAQQQDFRLSSESLRALQNQGFVVRENIQFLTGDMENGKMFIVPIRTIQFSPGL